jgi:hypothetical protein
MPNPQAVLWIDHKEARLFSVDGAIAKKVLATPPDEEEHRPNKAIASGRRGEHIHERYYAAVLLALRDAGSFLVCGPSTAKVELSRYLKKHAPDIERRIAGVETVDHPTDRQLVARAKAFFDVVP